MVVVVPSRTSLLMTKFTTLSLTSNTARRLPVDVVSHVFLTSTASLVISVRLTRHRIVPSFVRQFPDVDFTPKNVCHLYPVRRANMNTPPPV